VGINRYKQRDEVLKSIGFSSYKEYLASNLWKSIRARVLREFSTCQCGKPATQVHHRSYKKRYLLGRGKLRLAMKPICEDCHKQIEFDGDQKTSLGRANAKLADIAKAAKESGVVIPAKHFAKQSVTCECGKTFSSEGKRAAHLRTSRKCKYSAKRNPLARNSDR